MKVSDIGQAFGEPPVSVLDMMREIIRLRQSRVPCDIFMVSRPDNPMADPFCFRCKCHRDQHVSDRAVR